MSKAPRAATSGQQLAAGAQAKRVVIEFPGESHDKLVELKERSHASTLADLVRRALKLFEFFVQQREEGWSIQLVKNGETRQVEILF